MTALHFFFQISVTRDVSLKIFLNLDPINVFIVCNSIDAHAFPIFTI